MMANDGDRKPLTALTELGPFHAMFEANAFLARCESAIGRTLTPVERAEMMAWHKASSEAAERFLLAPDAVEPDSVPHLLRQVLAAMRLKAAK